MKTPTLIIGVFTDLLPKWVRDPSMRVEVGDLQPEEKIQISGGGEVETVRGNSLGLYTLTSRWSQGKCILQN